MGPSIPTFNVGIRFEPLGTDTTSDSNIEKAHWSIVFTPSDGAKWSLRVEMVPGRDGILYFPVRVFDSRMYAHDLATYTGYLDDVLKLMEVHPMRGTMYSSQYNNCQHWAATLLVSIAASGAYAPGRWYKVTDVERHNKVLKVLKISGSSIYHAENWWLDTTELLAVMGSSAAATGTAIAAEATTTVSAGGLLGWLGATVTVPAVGAGLAAAALPVAGVVAFGTGGMYVYRSYWWRRATTFPDPRRQGCLATDGKPLSAQETGESACGPGGSLTGLTAGLASGFASGLVTASASANGVLLGAYVGQNVARLFAAFSPGSAAKYAPSVASKVAYGVARVANCF
jgi:hypothetical protein